MANKVRSLVKAFSWRIFASFITVIVVWFVSGDLQIGFGVGIMDFVLKLIAYYGHERIWANIAWGRSDHNPKINPNAG